MVVRKPLVRLQKGQKERPQGKFCGVEKLSLQLVAKKK